MKRILILGASGTIGHQMVKYFKRQNCFVRAVDIREPEYSKSEADENKLADLTRFDDALQSVYSKDGFDQVIQLAAEMGGAQFIFTGDHDAVVMRNSALININVLEACKLYGYNKIFFSSSACVYPESLQVGAVATQLAEEFAWQGKPDSRYGVEKLFTEDLMQAYGRNHEMDIRVARFHNIYGPECHYKDIRAKAPAAICYKVASCPPNGTIEIIGSGKQVRSFLSVEECIEGVIRLLDSSYRHPLNIGSDEAISISDFTKMVIDISGRTDISVRQIKGPEGVQGRNSDNLNCMAILGWKPTEPLRAGITRLYSWVKNQVDNG